MDDTMDNTMDYYDEDRVSKLREIVPRFNSHVRKGDKIAFGIKNDPFYPEKYKANRPLGVVLKVKNQGPNASIRVRMEGTYGRTVDIAPHNLHPERLWEWQDDFFQTVLERTRPVVQQEAATFRGGPMPRMNDGFDELRAKVDALTARLESHTKEYRNMTGSMLDSFGALTSEVSAKNPERSEFAKAYSESYRSFKENGGKLPPAPDPSPFDSDFESGDEFDD